MSLDEILKIQTSRWCHLRFSHRSNPDAFNQDRPFLPHTHLHYFTLGRIKSPHTLPDRRSASLISGHLSHSPLLSHSHGESERENERKAAEREQREKRICAALVCLREMMDEVERCDDLAHRSNPQWETTYEWHLFLFPSFFKWNPVFYWEIGQTLFSHSNFFFKIISEMFYFVTFQRNVTTYLHFITLLFLFFLSVLLSPCSFFLNWSGRMSLLREGWWLVVRVWGFVCVRGERRVGFAWEN